MNGHVKFGAACAVGDEIYAYGLEVLPTKWHVKLRTACDWGPIQ